MKIILDADEAALQPPEARGSGRTGEARRDLRCRHRAAVLQAVGRRFRGVMRKHRH
ncbi:MAG: hypothetical protein ACLU9S_12875 [Oscillospiraceae bacterium]